MPVPDEGRDEHEELEDPAYPRNAALSGRRSSSPAQRFQDAKSHGAFLLPSTQERPHTDPLIRSSRNRFAVATTLVVGAALLAVYWLEGTSWTRSESLVTLGSGIILAVVGGFGLLWVVWKGPAHAQEQLLEDFE